MATATTASPAKTVVGDYSTHRSHGYKGQATMDGELYDIYGATCNLGEHCCCDALAIPHDTDAGKWLRKFRDAGGFSKA